MTGAEIFVHVLYIVGGVFGLLAGGNYLVRGAANFARNLGVSVMVVALTIVAMGTSMPELVVSVNAALMDKAAITVGNAVGSNIFNLLPTLGCIALLKPVVGQSAFIRREIPIMLVAMFLTFGFACFGTIYRWEAGIFLVLLLAYLIFAVYLAGRERETAKAEEVVDEALLDDPKTPTDPNWLCFVFMIGGFGVMILGSNFFLQGAVAIAEGLGISDVVIGLTLVAAGTSFPELFTSLIAVWKGEDDIALGNVVGSSIFNILAILGCAGVIQPLEIDHELIVRDIPMMIGAGLFTWLFVWTNRQIDRWEGLLLLIAYLAYITYLVREATQQVPTPGG